MKDDRIYRLHILECIRRIEEDTSDGNAAFLASHTENGDAAITNLHLVASAIAQGNSSSLTDL